MERFGLLAGVSSERLDELLGHCPVLELGPGETLLETGQENHAVYLLLSGCLKVHQDESDSDDCLPIVPGEFVGELSIIDGEPVSACVIAEKPSRLLVIAEEEFWERLMPMPTVARNFLAALSQKMRTASRIIVERVQQQLAYRHMVKELQIARGIQESMLPSRFPLFPERKEVDIFAAMHAAKEVGGDFYDAFFIAPGQLFLCIGDVSGKGISAALFMVRCLTQIRTETRYEHAPHDILRRINRALCENNESAMFVTVFCAVLDIAAGELVYSNGGHNAPLTSSSRGQFDFIPMPRGVLIGVHPDARFSCLSLTLQPGQALLAYTDGVTEALNDRDELFGDDRLRAILSEQRHADAQGVVDAVRRGVNEFIQATPQSDDITLIALRYLG
jgi:sigma-B regulation protein RsbU (phosphoserine phosphatase)